jgi:hypothetical protein
MKDKIEKWISDIDEITLAFKANFEHLDKKQLNKKPNSKTWSIGENIDHLIVINTSYFDPVEKIKAGDYKLGFISKIGFLTRFFGKMILSSVQPDNKSKIRTFPVWEPSKSDFEIELLEQFINHQEALKKLIISSENLLLKGALIASPANNNIIYKLEDAFDIIVSHEKRHLEQAKSILNQL